MLQSLKDTVWSTESINDLSGFIPQTCLLMTSYTELLIMAYQYLLIVYYLIILVFIHTFLSLYW